MNVKFLATSVYERNVRSIVPIVINRGGAGSSKSHSLAQLLALRAITCPERRILCLRKTRAAIHDSLWYMIRKILYDIMESLGQRMTIRENKTTHSLTFSNKSYIHMDGLDDPEKRKSSEWNDIWFEEANEFSWGDYSTMSLYNRATPKGNSINQIFLSFNPTDENSWLKTKLIDSQIVYQEIHSTFLDNSFLDKSYTDKLKNLIKQDVNFYRIYALGQWGKLENIIYHNWDTVAEMPENVDDTFYALDFGFNNPSCLLEIRVKDQEFYIDERLYEAGLTNTALIRRLHDLGISRYDNIYADSSEPDRITEIGEGISGEKIPGFNIYLAYKAVFDGIDTVKRSLVHITARSHNVLKEIRSYSWKKDRQENILDEPVKYLDHAMDAERYGIATYLRDRDQHINVAPRCGVKMNVWE